MWHKPSDLIRSILPREFRVPTVIWVAIAVGVAATAAVFLIPLALMSDTGDDRRDVATFIAGLFSILLALIVFARLGLETAEQTGRGKGAFASGRRPVAGSDPSLLRLTGVDLREAILPHAQLNDVELSDARLDDADLRLAEMEGSKLIGATLRRADLREARMAGADLQAADLQRADLRGADLKNANLQGASLRDALLEGALYNSETIEPGGPPLSERGARFVDEGDRPPSI